MLRFHASSTTTPKAKHEREDLVNLSFSSFTGLSAHDIGYSSSSSASTSSAARSLKHTASTRRVSTTRAAPLAHMEPDALTGAPPPLVSSPGSTCSSRSASDMAIIRPRSPAASDKRKRITSPKAREPCSSGVGSHPHPDIVEASSSSPEDGRDPASAEPRGHYGADSNSSHPAAAAGCGDGSNSPLSASAVATPEVEEPLPPHPRSSSHNSSGRQAAASAEERQQAIEESRRLLQDKLKREANERSKADFIKASKRRRHRPLVIKSEKASAAAAATADDVAATSTGDDDDDVDVGVGAFPSATSFGGNAAATAATLASASIPSKIRLPSASPARAPPQRAMPSKMAFVSPPLTPLIGHVRTPKLSRANSIGGVGAGTACASSSAPNITTLEGIRSIGASGGTDPLSAVARTRIDQKESGGVGFSSAVTPFGNGSPAGGWGVGALKPNSMPFDPRGAELSNGGGGGGANTPFGSHMTNSPTLAPFSLGVMEKDSSAPFGEGAPSTPRNRPAAIGGFLGTDSPAPPHRPPSAASSAAMPPVTLSGRYAEAATASPRVGHLHAFDASSVTLNSELLQRHDATFSVGAGSSSRVGVDAGATMSLLDVGPTEPADPMSSDDEVESLDSDYYTGHRDPFASPASPDERRAIIADSLLGNPRSMIDNTNEMFKKYLPDKVGTVIAHPLASPQLPNTRRRARTSERQRRRRRGSAVSSTSSVMSDAGYGASASLGGVGADGHVQRMSDGDFGGDEVDEVDLNNGDSDYQPPSSPVAKPVPKSTSKSKSFGHELPNRGKHRLRHNSRASAGTFKHENLYQTDSPPSRPMEWPVARVVGLGNAPAAAAAAAHAADGVGGRRRRAAAVAADRTISATVHNEMRSSPSFLRHDGGGSGQFGTWSAASSASSYGNTSASLYGSSTSASNTHVGVRRTANAMSSDDPSSAAANLRSMKRRRITTRSGMVVGAPERPGGGVASGASTSSSSRRSRYAAACMKNPPLPIPQPPGTEPYDLKVLPAAVIELLTEIEEHGGWPSMSRDSWCRYCGARFASAFSRSPWGPRRLCTPHYVKVFQHRSLDLDNFPEEPKTAINPSANTEIQYLERILAKVKTGKAKHPKSGPPLNCRTNHRNKYAFNTRGDEMATKVLAPPQHNAATAAASASAADLLYPRTTVASAASANKRTFTQRRAAHMGGGVPAHTQIGMPFNRSFVTTPTPGTNLFTPVAPRQTVGGLMSGTLPGTAITRGGVLVTTDPSQTAVPLPPPTKKQKVVGYVSGGATQPQAVPLSAFPSQLPMPQPRPRLRMPILGRPVMGPAPGELPPPAPPTQPPPVDAATTAPLPPPGLPPGAVGQQRRPNFYRMPMSAYRTKGPSRNLMLLQQQQVRFQQQQARMREMQQNHALGVQAAAAATNVQLTSTATPLGTPIFPPSVPMPTIVGVPTGGSGAVAATTKSPASSSSAVSPSSLPSLAAMSAASTAAATASSSSVVGGSLLPAPLSLVTPLPKQ